MLHRMNWAKGRIESLSPYGIRAQNIPFSELRDQHHEKLFEEMSDKLTMVQTELQALRDQLGGLSKTAVKTSQVEVDANDVFMKLHLP